VTGLERFGRHTYDEATDTWVAKPAESLHFDAGKARFDLLPPEFLQALAQHMTVGAVKYTDRNWESGTAWGRHFGSLQRHAWAWWAGQDLDPETGTNHLIALAWNAMALYVWQTRGLGTDDRVKCGSGIGSGIGTGPSPTSATASPAPAGTHTAEQAAGLLAKTLMNKGYSGEISSSMGLGGSGNGDFLPELGWEGAGGGGAPTTRLESGLGVFGKKPEGALHAGSGDHGQSGHGPGGCGVSLAAAGPAGAGGQSGRSGPSRTGA